MIKVRRPQLYAFLQHTNGEMDEEYEQYVAELDEDQPTEQAITEKLFIELRDAVWGGDLVSIMVDFEVSEHHHGGDVFVAVADEVSDAIENGQTIVTWYGSSSEVLIASYNQDVIEVVD